MAFGQSADEFNKNLDQSAEKIANFARQQNPNLSAEDMNSISSSAKEYMQNSMADLDCSRKGYGALAIAFHAKADAGPYNQAKEMGVIFDKQGNISDMALVKPSEEQTTTNAIAKSLNMEAKTPDDLLKADSGSATGYTVAITSGPSNVQKFCP